MVPRIPRRACNTCGKVAACYFAGGGWNCSGCAAARVVTGRLADTLEMLAEIARDGPKETKNIAKAFRRGAANAFWGRMLQDMADRIEDSAAGQDPREPENGGATETKRDRRDEIRSALLEKAQSMTIRYDFPDLVTAYEKGEKHGPRLDKEYRELHDSYVRRCKTHGYVPCEHRAFKAPDEQRWAANYLRHKCSGYENAYEQLQEEARELLEPDSPQPDLEGADVIDEMIHQVIKNRVQEQIATQFPELAEAAREQRV